MSIQVQGRVQALYGVYAANEALSAVQTQERYRPEAPRKDAVPRKAGRSVRFSTA